MLDTQLIQLCKEGNTDEIRSLIADKADVNAVMDGCSPLRLAIEANNLDLLDVLMQAGADPSRVFGIGETVLMTAALRGYLEVVLYLLQHQPASLINAFDYLGHTALFLAIQHSKVNVASALLDAGADATIRTLYGTTTLMVCSDPALAERLLEKGVDVNAQDERFMDAIAHALRRDGIDMAFLLLSRGATGYTRDQASLVHACVQGHTELAVMMLRQGPPVRGDDTEWDEWLHGLDNAGNSVLHVAVQKGHVNLVQALVDADFDVDVTDRCGAPALHYAQDVEIARILLDAGAEDFMCDNGEMAVSLASKDPRLIEVLRLLLQRFPDCDDDDDPLFFIAVEENNLEAVEPLLAIRPPGDINKQNPYGCTALYIAEEPEMVQLLLDLGADPRILDDDQQTPLIMGGTAARVRLLLDAAPDIVGVRDVVGRTTVSHFSCDDRHHVALKELLQYCKDHGLDACVNNKDTNEDTALHIAMMGCYLPTVKLLLENGAEVLGSGHDHTTTLMKPFLKDVLFSDDAYLEIVVHRGERNTQNLDLDMSMCLQALLDAVLLRGDGSGDAGVDADVGGHAETVDEPAAKRRRMNTGKK
jgi:ankyrin repeat protein